jgi:hypothetical protein
VISCPWASISWQKIIAPSPCTSDPEDDITILRNVSNQITVRHSVLSQKTWIFSNPAVRTSNIAITFHVSVILLEIWTQISIMLCTPVCWGHTLLSIIDINFICRVPKSVHQQTFTKLCLKIRCSQERERSLAEYETKEGRLWLVKSLLSY